MTINTETVKSEPGFKNIKPESLFFYVNGSQLRT